MQPAGMAASRTGSSRLAPVVLVICSCAALCSAAAGRELADATGDEPAPVFAPGVKTEFFRSQVKQDQWVLGHHPEPGYYLDMGARDGEQISNSFALDHNGWKGTCIEPFPTTFQERTCTLAREVMSNVTGQQVEFVLPDPKSIYGQGYGGMRDTISWDFIVDYNGTTFANVTTLDVRDFLVKYDIPEHIDYWSLDIEGAEYWVLKRFPFCDYYVGLLTVEHNWQEPRRTMIRDLLEHHGFVNERQVEYDDWYRNTRPPPSRQRGALRVMGLFTQAHGSAAGISPAAKFLVAAVAVAIVVACVRVLAQRQRSRKAWRR